MTTSSGFEDFDAWRKTAREQLQQGVPPQEAIWSAKGDRNDGLFSSLLTQARPTDGTIFIPKEFLKLAKNVACHRDPERWALLYSTLWRLAQGEKHLLLLATDNLVRRLRLMEKAVRRDAHKAKAFVRFKQTKEAESEHYIAWHESDHDILPLVAPFFQRRFSVMRWTIMTPFRSVNWDGTELLFGPGVPESQALATNDAMEDMWRTYYRATFNPARIKLKMMRQEMPERYWKTMPETAIIADLLAEAPARVAAMIATQEGLAASAADFLPTEQSIPALRAAAAGCQGCPLYRNATCTVFGAGPEQAQLMIVGEQPGEEEDKAGLPFVGPAGRVFDRALGEIGFDRAQIYVTNAVKHFKFEQRGKKRIHSSPNVREITACRPWLNAEIATVRPKVIVTLGATAGRSLFGPGFTLKAMHGRWHDGPESTKIRPSWHPAAVLRANGVQQQEIYAKMTADLREAAQLLRTL